MQRAILKDRVAHAYLFYGPYGSGKRAAAVAFAKALQCTEAEADGCGTCTNCRRIDAMNHPDVRFLIPAPNKTPHADITARRQEMGRNPYQTVDYLRRPHAKAGNRHAQYLLETLTDQIRPVTDHTAFEGGYKVVVITDAEALAVQTSNGFLKILEEPLGKTVFILTAERPDRLLPTILSRCQPIRFAPLSPTEIEEALVTRWGVPRNEVQTLARLSEGSISIALDLRDDEETKANRRAAMPFLRAVYSAKGPDLTEYVDRIGTGTVDQMRRFFVLLLGVIRDLVLVRELGTDAPITNVDLGETLRKFCASLADARLDEMAALVDEAIILASRQINRKMIMSALVASLRDAMLGLKPTPLGKLLAEQLADDLD